MLRAIGVCNLVLFGILVFAAATPPASANSPAAGPFIGRSVRPASFSGSLSSLAAVPVKKGYAPRVIPLGRLPVKAQAPTVQIDTSAQSLLPLPAMPAPSQTFPGLGFGDNCEGGQCGAGWPPDPNGDAGINYYVQAVNTSIGVYSKATGARLLAITFDQFWSAASGTGTPCDNRNAGDPIVLFDSLAQRWLITDFAFNFNPLSGPYYECVAVSKSEDPVNGGWWFYPVLADITLLNDYPKFGVWPDGYYLTANMFNGAGVLDSVWVWALDRNEMISGQPIAPVYFKLPNQYFSLLPANWRGYAPPAGAPAPFLALDWAQTNRLWLWRFHFDAGTPANSWFGSTGPGTSPIPIGVASYSKPCGANRNDCIPQRGTAQRVDAIGDRLMMPLQYQNLNGLESLWVAHTVAGSTLLDSQTGIRWYEIRDPNGVPWLRQQSTFKPADGTFRWLPSVAVDKTGNLAVGYSASSKTLFPSIRVSGRKWADPLRSLKQGESVLKAGQGSQLGGIGADRWGDYSSMSIDPVDGCTFWYTNEYYATTGQNWQTSIGSFKFPDCGALAPMDEADLRVQYEGWVGISNPFARGGAYRYSQTPDDTVSIKFIGSAITWNYISGPDGGMARVLIDGKDKGTVDQYSASINYSARWRLGGLSAASHTLTVQVLNSKNPLSSGNKIVVDSFGAGTTIFQESAVAVTWGGWRGAKTAYAIGGKYRYSQTPGDTVTIPFWGNGITWIGSKGPDHGLAQIWVDNDTSTVNLYNPTLLWRQPLFSVSGLSDGYHTMRVAVLNDSDPASTGKKVSIDNIQFTQP